jgi:hypothetical protein
MVKYKRTIFKIVNVKMFNTMLSDVHLRNYSALGVRILRSRPELSASETFSLNVPCSN